MRLLEKIFAMFGKIIGMLRSQSLDFVVYILKRNFTTGVYARRFKSFGRGSLLASPIRLINPQNIEIGQHSSIMKCCVLETCPDAGNSPLLTIGNNMSLGEYSHITCAKRIIIGDNLLTGRFVLITDNGHGCSSIEEIDTPPLKRKTFSKGKVVIGDNVWIGDKATILPGVTIGDGAIIGANSVVTKDIPANSIAAGNPARVVKIIK